MALLPLILAKFIVYWVICRLAPRILTLDVAELPSFAFKWAGVRLGIGLISGVGIFYGFALLESKGFNDVTSYALSFGLARYIEWALVYLLIMRSEGKDDSEIGKQGHAWIALGTCCNVAMDTLVLTTGLADNLKFVC
jgi:hypothetical protein